MEEDYKKRYRVILTLFIIACLIIFGYIIYSQIYKAKIQEAYNQGQLDASIFITQQVWDKHLIPYPEYNELNNQTTIDFMGAGDYWSRINNPGVQQ